MHSTEGSTVVYAHIQCCQLRGHIASPCSTLLTSVWYLGTSQTDWSCWGDSEGILLLSWLLECGVAGTARHSSGDSCSHLPSRHSSSSLLRSRSSQSLRPSHDGANASAAADDRLTVLVQMFWISVSLLESDFEYEFLLAVRLLDKVNHSPTHSAVYCRLLDHCECVKFIRLMSNERC